MKLEVSKNLQLIEAYYKKRLGEMQEVKGFSKEDVLKYYLAKSRKIMNDLNKKGIKYTLEEKEGWGIIFVFNRRGNKLFTNNYRYDLLDVYYYSDSYSCIPYEYNL